MAQEKPLEARYLHVETPVYLATLSRELGIPFVTLSSDYVFSGQGKQQWNESDSAEPINAYGRSKREGEQAVLAVYSKAKIIRTSGLFGSAPAGSKVSFPERVLQQVRAGQIPVIRSDLTTSICHVDDLARDLWMILWNSLSGVFHVAHAGGATWLQIAETALRAAGVSSSLKATQTADFPRPPCATLTSIRPELRAGSAGRKSWQDALEGFMRSLRDA